MENQSAALFCAKRCEAARVAMGMAARSSNHDFCAVWDSPGNSAYWWESLNGNDTTRTRIAD